MESCRWVCRSDSCAFHTHSSPWKSWEVVDWPFGPRRLVVGKTCPMQPGWVGVLALCVPGWSDSSLDCCGRLSKEKRLFSSHQGNNQIVSLLPFPSMHQNIVNLGVGTQWRIFWFSTCVCLCDSSFFLILWGCFPLTSSALPELIFVSARENTEINSFW